MSHTDSPPPSDQHTAETDYLTPAEHDELIAYFLRGSEGGALTRRVREIVRGRMAQAWDEGATKASPHGGAYLRSLLIENPYRDVVTSPGERGDA